jgi:hypothetical protein
MFPNRMQTGLAILLIAVLTLTGGLAATERHDHGPLVAGHECAACQIAGSAADLPTLDDAAGSELAAEPGDVLEPLEVTAPEAPCFEVPRLRGPPLV